MCNFSGSTATLISGKKGITLPIPMEEEEVDLNDVVMAWRCWDHLSDGRLCGTYVRMAWEPGEVMQAHSIYSSGDSGLYAFEAEKHALSQGSNSSTWGQVALWGKIYRHKGNSYGTPGYRAQFGYPLSLFTTDRVRAMKLANLYGPSGVYVNIAQRADAVNPGRLTFVN